jgi:DNA replication protein DnaC
MQDIQADSLKPLCYAYGSEQANKYEGKLLVDFTTDKERGYTKIKKIAEAYLTKWEGLSKEGIGMYFYSDSVGCGKTLLACIIANELYNRNKVASQIYTMNDLFTLFQESFSNSDISSLRILNVIKSVPLLILDEIGFEAKKTDWRHDKVLEIIDTRYQSGKPTIFTSNVDIKDLPYHPRVASRVEEMGVLIEFPDYDHRQDEADKRQKQLLNKITG